MQALGAITRDDRMGAAYRAQPLIDGQTGIVDVELWPVLKFREMARKFGEWCEAAGLSILDRVQQPTLVLLRIKGEKRAIERMLEHRDVRVVDMPPSFQLERSELEVVAGNAGAIQGPSDEAPVVAVLDSGIASNHPLLAAAVADAQSYLEEGDAEDEAGHGTAVAGLALYGDVYECSQRPNFTATFWVASARVLDDKATYDGKLIHNQIGEAVADFVKQYGCRIFNVSLGDSNRPYVGGHVRGLAVELDRLAREYGVLFVVSSGNYDATSSFDEHAPNWLKEYPEYLAKRRAARICDPAPALNVLTVGALARFEKCHQAQRYPDDPAYQCIAKKFEPAPFSRTGPGANGCIKPELADFGGNWAVDLRNPDARPIERLLGEPSLEREFIGRGRWLSDFVGTSFAAPKVAHAAGRLLVEYPDASANLLRAILVAHAAPPPIEASALRPQFKDLKSVLNFWGYGQVRVERAIYSTEECATIYAESSIGKDQHHFYELPVPDDFLQPGRAKRTISIGLSHMPRVRTTRLEYKASALSFRLVKHTSLEALSRVFVQCKKEAREKLVKEFRPSTPSSDVRGRGSVQAAQYRVGQLTAADKDLRLFVVVTHSVEHRGETLVPDEEPYALAVVFEAQAQVGVRFFTQMQAKLKQRIRQRGRARS